MNARVEEIIADLAGALTDGVSRKHSLELARDYATRLLDAAQLPTHPDDERLRSDAHFQFTRNYWKKYMEVWHAMDVAPPVAKVTGV